MVAENQHKRTLLLRFKLFLLILTVLFGSIFVASKHESASIRFNCKFLKQKDAEQLFFLSTS